MARPKATFPNAEKAFIKSGVQYYKCNDTGTIFCKKLDQSNMVGGTGEDARNNPEHNAERVRRVRTITNNGMPKVLDFGCGTGKLVQHFKDNGFFAFGFDPFNPEFPKMEQDLDCVTMVEVIEHLSHPFKEFDKIFDYLKKGGKLYIETTFADNVTEEHPYIDPTIGHCTIWSYKGLDTLLSSKGFKLSEVINNNVRVYEK